MRLVTSGLGGLFFRSREPNDGRSVRQRLTETSKRPTSEGGVGGSQRKLAEGWISDEELQVMARWLTAPLGRLKG